MVVLLCIGQIWDQDTERFFLISGPCCLRFVFGLSSVCVRFVFGFFRIPTEDFLEAYLKETEVKKEVVWPKEGSSCWKFRSYPEANFCFCRKKMAERLVFMRREGWVGGIRVSISGVLFKWPLFFRTWILPCVVGVSLILINIFLILKEKWNICFFCF